MKRMAKVWVVLVLAVALCQSATMAAPTQAASRVSTNSGNHYGLLNQFFGLLGAIWGNHGAIWGGGHAAIWGSDSGASSQGAIWGCGARC